MFDYLEDVIDKAAGNLKIVGHTILETISYSRLIMIHQNFHQRTRNYSIVMLQDYYLQAKGQARGEGPTYKYVLHFFAHK